MFSLFLFPSLRQNVEGKERKKERKKGIYWMSVVVLFSLRHTKEKKRNHRGWVGENNWKKGRVGNWKRNTRHGCNFNPLISSKKILALKCFQLNAKEQSSKIKCFKMCFTIILAILRTIVQTQLPNYRKKWNSNIWMKITVS